MEHPLPPAVLPSDAWTPAAWARKPAAQQPLWPDPAAVQVAADQLAGLPPLVHPGEVNLLLNHLASVQHGRGFVLQGGDCAERFADCTPASIEAKLKILLQMSLILCHAARQPVVRIGRIAGQYAKPRSSPTEVLNGRELPSYRGDIVNDIAFSPQARLPDPARMLRAYLCSAATLNYLRAMVAGGFADLHNPGNWELQQLHTAPAAARYDRICREISDAIDFMDSLGGARRETLRSVELYTSHEALLLPYEQAMTRPVPGGNYMNLSAHMLWLGERTRDLDGAHVEYLRGIANPVGIKLGPTAEPRQVLELLRRLNPHAIPGKLTLITRMGRAAVRDSLPPLIRAVRDARLPVLWSCDPMHGNMCKSRSGQKTRHFDDILHELRESFAIHDDNGTRLSGVHFEMTGEDVTECIGGAGGVSDDDLTSERYVTTCDPRLNCSQSLEIALLISEMLRSHLPRTPRTEA